RSGMRWAKFSTTYLTWPSALPKIALATSFATSMSKPSRPPVIGLRYPKRRLSADTPTVSALRSLIELTVGPLTVPSGLDGGAYDSTLVLFPSWQPGRGGGGAEVAGALDGGAVAAGNVGVLPAAHPEMRPTAAAIATMVPSWRVIDTPA